MTNQQFQLLITGGTGLSYIVQASTNLVTWTKVFTTNATVTPFLWSDPATMNFSRRFYRVLTTL